MPKNDSNRLLLGREEEKISIDPHLNLVNFCVSNITKNMCTFYRH